MYAGLILESLGIKHEILEADKRTGGRVWTYHFEPNEPRGTHDYFVC
jgi:monoamine oxidase